MLLQDECQQTTAKLSFSHKRLNGVVWVRTGIKNSVSQIARDTLGYKHARHIHAL
jgi:hypothetical protein